jgi:hypothetical protein
MLPACGTSQEEAELFTEPGHQQSADPSDSTEQPLLSGDAAGWAYYTGSGLDASRSFNSTGGGNGISRSSVGVYTVTFGGLYGSSGGNVQVSAAGATRNRCKVGSWTRNPYSVLSDLQVSVRCHDPSGNPADAPFMVTYARFPGGTTVSSSGAYVWMNQPQGGALDSTYQWGAPSSVTWNGTGKYALLLPGQASANSNVQVTAYGTTGAQYCKVVSWGNNGAGDTVVNVHCFAPGGQPADSQFSLRYFRDTRDSRRGSGGFAWADQPYTYSYTPSLPYQRNVLYDSCGSGTPGLSYTNKAWRWTTGQYSIDYPSQWSYVSGAAALVTAYGPTADYCTLGSWYVVSNDTLGVDVRCFDSNGNAIDTPFSQVVLSPADFPC